MARLRYLVPFLTAVLLTIPNVAVARPTGTSWESRTDGSPVSTMQGMWKETDEGRSAEVVFAGGHLIQAGTTFRASWMTPFTTAGESPSFDTTYELENVNELGEDILIEQGFRFRPKGGRWTKWFSHRLRLEPASSSAGGGGFFQGFEKRQIQFEFRWTGRIEAPTYLRGSGTFSIN